MLNVVRRTVASSSSSSSSSSLHVGGVLRRALHATGARAARTTERFDASKPLGAYVDGIDIARYTKDDVAFVKDALNKHRVVFFRGQSECSVRVYPARCGRRTPLSLFARCSLCKRSSGSCACF